MFPAMLDEAVWVAINLGWVMRDESENEEWTIGKREWGGEVGTFPHVSQENSLAPRPRRGGRRS